MKTRILALLLTFILALSCASPAFASYNPADYDTTGADSLLVPPVPPIFVDDSVSKPWPSVAIAPGTVIVDVSCDEPRIVVIWWDQTIVSLSQQFVISFVTDEPVLSWAIASKEGYTSLAKEVVNWLVDTGVAYPTPDGFVYGEDVIYVDGCLPLETIADVIYAATGVNVKPIYRGEVELDVNYNGHASKTMMSIATYDELDDPGTDYNFFDSVWGMSAVSDDRVEVYFRSGMIMTLDREMIDTYLQYSDYVADIALGHRGDIHLSEVSYCSDRTLGLLSSLRNCNWKLPVEDLPVTDSEAAEIPYPVNDGNLVTEDKLIELYPEIELVEEIDPTWIPSSSARSMLYNPALDGFYSVWVPIEDGVAYPGSLLAYPVLNEKLEAARGSGTTVSFDLALGYQFDDGYRFDCHRVDFSFLGRDTNGKILFRILTTAEEAADAIAALDYLTDEDIASIVSAEWIAD